MKILGILDILQYDGQPAIRTAPYKMSVVPQGIDRGRCGVKFKTRWARNDQKQKYVEIQGKGGDCKSRSGWESMCISFLGLLQFPGVN